MTRRQAADAFTKRQNKRKSWNFLYIIAGIFLPLIAVLFETSTHFCARNVFDPFPSTGHVLLFLLIPATNALAWLSRKKDLSSHFAFLALASGMSAGIGVMYSLMFLPLVGLSLLLVLAGGFGLLGLSPFLSIPCTLHAGKSICHLATKHGTYFDPHLLKHLGHLIVLVMVVAIELPSTLTRIHLAMADKPDTAKQGIRWLRQFGNREVMLRACYERSGRATDILGSLYECTHPLQVDNARRIFYRVTGKAFNMVPLPASARATIQHAGLVSDVSGVNATVDDEFDLDADIAGEVVSGMARGLTSTACQVEGSIDANALTANLDWTIDLKNSSRYPREARAKMLLSPGSVLTGAALVINERSHEATIMVRGNARVRYVRSTGTTRKDPLLVSTCGPDQILMQCFPVPPNETRRIQLRMICPLTMDAQGRGVLSLPALTEQNFPDAPAIKLSLDSTKPVTARGVSITSEAHAGSPPQYKLTGTADTNALRKFNSFIYVARDKDCRNVYCVDPFAIEHATVEKRVEPRHYTRPRQLFIIVDGSEAMREHMPEISEGLKTLPRSMPVSLALVGDESKVLCQATDTSTGDQSFVNAINALQQCETIAGQDDSVALTNALSYTASHPGAAVLWIHAGQPVCEPLKDDVRKLVQHHQPVLYDFLVSTGPEEILSNLNSGSSIKRVARSGSVSSDLQSLNETWRQDADLSNPFNWRRNSVYGTNPLLASYQTNSGLVQLCAYDEILTEVGAATGKSDRADLLAKTYHEVTPVSSAIVKDVESDLVERVATGISPEADTWLLLLVAVAFLGGAVIHQRRKLQEARG